MKQESKTYTQRTEAYDDCLGLMRTMFKFEYDPAKITVNLKEKPEVWVDNKKVN